MARLGGLGKGLGALIPSEVGTIGGDVPRLVDLPVDSISPNPHQPRVHFDEESLADLAASIREIGVLQPVLVRPVSDGEYELVAGERRWRAARRAGLAVIPAIVRITDDLGSIERALVENLHRQDLTPLEEAAAYQQLIEDFELTHEQVATRVGKSRSAVTNTLRLMSLPPASSTCWPTAGCPPATPGPCSGPPIERSRSNSPGRRAPRTGPCGCSKRPFASVANRPR